MQFRTLDETPIENVSETFNKAFEDYEFNMQHTTEAFVQKLMRERIDLSKSVGAFDGNVMVGFILFGIGEFNGKLTAWDGGTGVLSDYRGQQLTQKMFAYIKRILKASGVKMLLLEVLQKNIPAYTTYQKIGFNITRELLAYKETYLE